MTRPTSFSDRHAFVAAAALAASVACADARPRNDDTVRAAPQMVQNAPAGSNTAATAADDDCGLLRVSLFPDPTALVKHYVALDNDARVLQTTPETDSVYACPNHLPGPDEFTVVTHSEVQPLSATDSVVRIVVRSARLGEMTQDSLGFVFVRNPGVVADTFVVLHTAFGWRIDSPQLPDRVLASTVLARTERFRLRAPVRDSLAAAVSRPDA